MRSTRPVCLRFRAVCGIVLCLLLSLPLLAQAPTPSQTTTVPHLVQFSGVIKGVGGTPGKGLVGITFALYKDEQGGAPLWLETQNVQVDAQGRYSVYLGATKSEGLPPELFASGQARWLGARPENQEEQPRILLLSVPYALKAGDSATLGGLPASAFLLAAGAAPVATPAPTASSASAPPPPAPCSVGSDNTAVANQVAKFSAGCNVEPSAITETAGNVGIGTSVPSTTLDVKGNSTFRGILTLPAGTKATATKAANSQPLNLAASAFNSGTAAAVNQNFRLQAEPLNNNTTTPSGTLNLLFGQGNGAFSETGLQIASNGRISFASGQTFPGAGTITGVTAGVDLTGGGNSGNVTLNLDTSKVPQLSTANTFTANQTVSANLSARGLISTVAQGTAPLQVTSTTQVPNLNASFVGGLSASAFQPAGSYATLGSNSFNGNQNVTGNVAATGSLSGAAANFSGLVSEAGALLPAKGAATASQGFTSQPTDSVTSVFNSSTAHAVNQDFRWQAEPVGNNTSSPSGKLNLLFGANGTTPAETGFSLASNGQMSFAAGQTFPGVGTITSVATGAGLTGGPITTSGTISIPSAGVSNAMLANPSLTINPGLDLLGGGLVSLGGSTSLGLDTSRVPELAANNTFTGIINTFTGNVSAANLTANNGAVDGAIAAFASSTPNAIGTFANTAGGPILVAQTTGFAPLVTISGNDPSTASLFVNATVASNQLQGILAFGGNSISSAAASPGLNGGGGNNFFDFGFGGSAGQGVVGNGGRSDFGPGGIGGAFGGGFGDVSDGFSEGDGIDASTANAFSFADSFAYAGNFAGDINVSGAVFAGTKDFKIDHPLDPANKYLFHASVESSEMKDIYDGSVTTDSQGDAMVQLPEWLEALNTDFRYQLTVIGQFAQAIIARKIENNRFEIRTSLPNVEVSWQVTGVRRDAYAKANPLVVEQEKPARERGFYIHPEFYGAPEEKGVEWARNPEWMRQLKERRLKAHRVQAKPSSQPVSSTSHANLGPVASAVVGR